MISEKQRRERAKYLGSSDMAAIVGFDPFRNAYDVWLEKTDKLEADKENVVMKRGRHMELAILNYAEEKLGPLEKDPAKLEFIKPIYHLLSHPDALFVKEPVEGKSQGNFSKEVWGEEGTDQVPDRVIIQCHVHLICTDTRTCYVPAYLPYREFQMFVVNFDYVIAQSIIEAAQHFWVEHVSKDTPPEDVVPTLAVVKRVRQLPNIHTELPKDLWEAFQAAKQDAKAAKDKQDKAQAKLLAVIGIEKFKQLRKR